jgi:hypothetical protein
MSALAAGCGDELADFRKNELRPLEQRADEQKARLSATLKTVQLGDASDAELLGSQVGPLEETYGELAKLDPPDDFEKTYGDYRAANAAFIAELRKFIAALRARDEAALERASERAQEAVGAAQRAIQPLHE